MKKYETKIELAEREVTPEEFEAEAADGWIKVGNTDYMGEVAYHLFRREVKNG